ncbi:MAG: AraC family transcriptional regulator [Verrucomicrobium sp.]|nr:AraC family transcriptional regulator [Verrucomicrobium sp.]
MKAEPTPPPPAEHEEGWEAIDGVWKPVYGSFPGKGFGIEWHEFSTAKEFDWDATFHEESLEVCLNFSGAATFRNGKAKADLGAEQIAFYTTTRRRVEARRKADTMHRFFTFEFSAPFLRGQLGEALEDVRPALRRFLENPARSQPFVEVMPMPPTLLAGRMHLLEPPVFPGAQPVWYQGKAAELISHLFFEPAAQEELFCHRHERVNRERCDRVLFLLERDLENPPSLKMLADEVGCSPFYLSRIFSQHTGSSIPKYLRLKRVEKAGELLRSGEMNVTEAAMAVGYSSLSSFTKAFLEHFGCCPGLYPQGQKLFTRYRPGS